MTTRGSGVPAPGLERVVTFRQVDPAGASIRCEIGDGIPVLSGDGGWTTVKRPRRKSLTEWDGYDPIVLTLPVLFDRFREGGSVEYEVERLRRMMRVPQGPRREPAVVQVVSPAVPLPDLRYVIQSMVPTVELRRRDGARTRAAFDMTLIEYVAADVLVAVKKPTPAATVAAKPPAPGAPPKAARTYTVKRGDTLGSIAARLLGKSSRYKEIAALNGIRDPNRISVGQVLKLP